MTDRELMQMANRIEALAFEMKAPNAYTPRFVMLANEIRAALRARLAQPEPEPVAWITTWNEHNDAGVELHWAKQDKGPSSKHTPLFYNSIVETNCKPVGWLYQTNNTWEQFSFIEPPDDAYDEGSLRPVYLSPPQSQWRGLTDDEIDGLWNGGFYDYVGITAMRDIVRAIEAKLREKNT